MMKCSRCGQNVELDIAHDCRGSRAINHDAHELYKKIDIMIKQWRMENRGKMPKYLFLSQDAYILLKSFGMDSQVQQTHFMGIEIAPVGVPGIYAGIGEWF